MRKHLSLVSILFPWQLYLTTQIFFYILAADFSASKGKNDIEAYVSMDAKGVSITVVQWLAWLAYVGVFQQGGSRLGSS